MDGKFSAIPKEMFDDKRLAALDIAVYAALDSYANSAGEAWPSITVLAERAKVSPATVKRSLSRLEGAGYVVRQRRHLPSSKEPDTTLYRLAFRRRRTGQNWPLANQEVGSYGTDAGSDEAGDGSDRTKAGSEICVMLAHSVQDVGEHETAQE
jgi:DNA-binding transcriptional ArsR family regulator